MLHQFIHNHHFPPGSFHLRPSTGIISKLVQESGRSKRESICKILRDFPHRKFVLVGDSGEIDLEIYTRIAKEFPGQIIKIFIRDITTNCRHHRSTQGKKRRRIGNKRSSTFPAFFSSNTTAHGSQRTKSTPDLSSTIIQQDHHTNITDDEDYDYEEGYDDDDNDNDEEEENLHDTASKLAELVLEPSLTGHQPLHRMPPSHIAEDLPADLSSDYNHSHQEPPSQSLMQLFSRLAIARRSVKGIDIVLFKEPKELYQDEKVLRALAKYKNSKQQQHQQ